MSRIHEALKKAELERVSLYGDFATLGSELQQTVEIRQENAPPFRIPTLAQVPIVTTEGQPNLRIFIG